jgi:hypothetical protein
MNMIFRNLENRVHRVGFPACADDDEGADELDCEIFF